MTERTRTAVAALVLSASGLILRIEMLRRGRKPDTDLGELGADE